MSLGMDFYIDRHVKQMYKNNNKQSTHNCCSHTNTCVDYKQNIVVCTDCGVVLGCPKPNTDTFDRMQSYSKQEDVGSCVKSKYATIQKQLDTKVLSTGERRIRRVRSIVTALCERMGVLQRIEDRSQSIVKYIVGNKETIKQVKKDELLCIVSVCMACRESKFPYTFRELAAVCHNVKPKEICRTFKMYERQICMEKIKHCKRPRVQLETCSYNLMIPRFCGMLGMDFLQQKKIRRMLGEVRRKCYKMKALNPMTKFAVAVLIEFPKTSVDEIHLVTGVSKHTILKSVALFQGSDDDDASRRLRCTVDKNINKLIT